MPIEGLTPLLLLLNPLFAAGLLVAALRLMRTREELRIIAHHAPAAIAHVVGHVTDLTYRFVNDAYAALYGRKAGEVIGRHPKHVLGPEVFARAEANMTRALAGETVTFDLALGDKLMQVVYALDRVSNGAISGFIGVITEVTELRRPQPTQV